MINLIILASMTALSLLFSFILWSALMFVLGRSSTTIPTSRLPSIESSNGDRTWKRAES